MVQAIFILLFFIVLGHIGIRYLKSYGIKSRDINFLHGLLWYHLLLSAAYFVYTLFNRSDSRTYYSTTESFFFGENWMSYYGVSTTFIRFLAYPFVRYIGFTYESTMVLFAFIGFLAFVYFFRFYREQIRVPVKVFGIDAVYFIMLLPNCHFWSASLGKGPVILLGVGLLVFALSKLEKRWYWLILAGLIIYHIRPHIFFVFLIAIALGYTLSSRKAVLLLRMLMVAVSVVVLVYIYQDILQLTGLDDESMLDPFISHRASELTKAGSGIDITNYNMAQKLFAFVFRPLFVDAPGVLGIIVSFENLIYLFLFIELIKPSSIKYLLKADPFVKTSLFAFGAVAIALAQISGNLGLAMRQKSQVMLLVLFVIIKIKEEKLVERWLLAQRKKKIQERRRKVLEVK